MYYFCTDQYNEACDLVTRYHYSKRIPSNVQMVCTLHEGGGLFGDFGDAVAALFFSIPPTRWSEEVWELSRLVATPRFEGQLSALISKSCKFAKRHHDLVISFADRTHQHHGGIYQACSWQYAGKRGERMDGVLIDGTFVAGRSCNSKWGTQSPAKLSDRLKKDVQPHFDDGKHLYWRALTRSGKQKAARLKLENFPYPKEFAERQSRKVTA